MTQQVELRITADTRLNHILDGVPGALEYIVALNPHDFGRLNNPLARKYMSPRISLRRVAAMAGVAADSMVADLRALAGGAAAIAPANEKAVAVPLSPATAPAWMDGLAERDLHWVDLLPIDSVLGDPMLPVTVAVRRLVPGETIAIRHRWEPQPLYDIWSKMGLAWFARRANADEWHIFVHKPLNAPPAVPMAAGRSIMVEVRHIPQQEAPQRVLVAFEQLRPGESMELWVAPGQLEQALAALQVRHAGEFRCQLAAPEAGKQVVMIFAQDPSS